ncbi:MAG: hypothetical protein AB2598_05255 [Candidatus Thiodiazotropha sp.]
MEHHTSTTPATRRRSNWKSHYFILLVLWLALLYGFTSTLKWIGLSLLGAALVVAGIRIIAYAQQTKRDNIHYNVTLLFGLMLLACSLPTLAPGLPASLLTLTSPASSVLEARALRLAQTIDDDNRTNARLIATRGLGDPVPRDKHGLPVLLGVKDADLLKDLIAAGLSPDASNTDGKTLLMLTDDLDLATVLLESGADPNARDLEGGTALSHAYRKDRRYRELLLDAGADVHAVDNAEIAVVDYYPDSGPERELLEAYAGNSPLSAPRSFAVADRGRRGWIVTMDSRDHLPPSALSITPSFLHYDDSATVTVRLSNASDQDRLLDVRASISAAFFVAASHGGRVENPHKPFVGQTIRWPRLTLPAHSMGELTFDIVTDLEYSKGDLHIDLRSRAFGHTEDEVLYLSKKLEYPQYTGEPADSSWGDILGIVIFIASFVVALPMLMRGSTSKVSVAAAGAAAIVCGGVFVVLLWGMVEPWVAFDETSCEILDQRIGLKTTTTSTRRVSGHMTSTTTVTGYPLVAVRLMDQGQEKIRVGFATGMAWHPTSELSLVQLGETVPCWYDPEDNRQFTVVRTPGIRGIAGLIFLSLLTLGLFALTLSLRKDKVQLTG